MTHPTTTAEVPRQGGNQRTPKHALIDVVLERNGHPPLRDITDRHRCHGSAWATVAADVGTKTTCDDYPDGITVSVPSLISWFPDLNRSGLELAERDEAAA